jgi:transcriptional regulator with XRE-family HTH domain
VKGTTHIVNDTTHVVNINGKTDTNGVDTHNNLGDLIRERRELLGLTGRSLAASAEMDATMLSRIETGRMKALPEPELLRTLSFALGCSMTDFLEAAGYLDHTDLATDDTPVVRELTGLLRQITWNEERLQFVRVVLTDLARRTPSPEGWRTP